MFHGYEFSFDGESSYAYGLMLYSFGGNGQDDVSFGNRASIVEERTALRVRPLHFGVNYHNSPLQFKLVFGALEEPMDRYDLEQAALWLTGHRNYRWLSIAQPDLERVQFRCLVTQLTPLSSGGLPYAFEAQVQCDCPYAYGYPFEERYKLDGEKTALLRNDGSAREYLWPALTYNAPDGGTLRIVNHSDGGRVFSLSGLPPACAVTVDNENGIIRETVSGVNLYGGFNRNFFRLVQGDNRLTLTGNGTLTVSGRKLYNVGG